MEQLAAFVGWIDTKDTILNLNTGMTIEAIDDDGDGAAVQVTFPSGDVQTFFGEDGNAILDRAEMFASIGDNATRIIKAGAEQAATAAGVPNS